MIIEGISKRFIRADGSVLSVLEDLSFNLPAGKIVSILGASGCGKSTLLKIVAGIIAPDSGQVLTQLDRPGPELGFLQQGERPLPWRSVRDNILLGLELIGGIPNNIDLLIERVGLADFASALPSQLSGGMIQRMLVARTLATEPKLLLLDEPLGQLDIVGRRDMARVIRDYVTEKCASGLLVTHSVEEAVFMSDVVITLSRRPSRIVNKFEIDQNRERSFDLVLKSLLGAISGDSSVQ